MLEESEATRLWQRLFRGQEVTSQTLVEAATVVDAMHPESPLRLRLSTELSELQVLHGTPAKKSR